MNICTHVNLTGGAYNISNKYYNKYILWKYGWLSPYGESEDHGREFGELQVMRSKMANRLVNESITEIVKQVQSATTR